MEGAWKPRKELAGDDSGTDEDKGCSEGHRGNGEEEPMGGWAEFRDSLN